MIITLTTDFGARDGYAGAIKGVIASRAPRATVFDISHEIPSFDIAHAAFVLFTAAPFYPPGTVHVAVIDPGVGGARRGVVVVGRQHLFVGPDNGVFTPFLDEAAAVHELADPDLWLGHAAATFHGRDLFAPTAVHLAQGLAPADCGPTVAEPVRLPAWNVEREGDALVAAVVHVDGFGNAITGLSTERLAELGEGSYAATIAGHEPIAVRRTYADADSGQLLALIGSTGLLELAVREGSAAAQLGLQRGDAVRFVRMD